MKWKSFLTISLLNFQYLPDEDEKNVEAKNRGEKIWKNEFDSWVFHIKTRLHDNFHENLKRKNLTQFVRHFWLIEAKMKM